MTCWRTVRYPSLLPRVHPTSVMHISQVPNINVFGQCLPPWTGPDRMGMSQTICPSLCPPRAPGGGLLPALHCPTMFPQRFCDVRDTLGMDVRCRTAGKQVRFTSRDAADSGVGVTISHSAMSYYSLFPLTPSVSSKIPCMVALSD